MSPLPVWATADAQGKCLFDFLVWADGDDLLLDCEAKAPTT
jgi:folate-binding Fe-S cluster repair protein YgfZ